MPGPICSQNGSASGGSSSEYPALASETEVADRATPSESIAVTLAPGTGPPSSLTIRPPWYVVSVAAAGKAKSSEGEAVVSSGPALVVVQIALGVLTITTFKDLVPLTAHLLVGALLLADYVSLLALTRAAPQTQLVEAMA